ncbi:hypothetical protein SAMN05421788_11840 [Filimonas lacunae]|uniref:Uncharacterized protein n=1 Tax=Filimonas lacunae TaxID=477680 RepID=A0A173MBF9_9BACT|nr:hypothetical protein FLA_0839 [Filimonas lacunae]SIT34685.1 hypothetical protein SAMN05421788_11840 [Filimonas lacunae]
MLVSGIVWACAGGWEEDYSVFSPEYFVDSGYSPFFYDSYNAYYADSYEERETKTDNNARYNHQLIKEWNGYLEGKMPEDALDFLLTRASRNAVDSVGKKLNGKLQALPAGYPDFNQVKADKKKLQAFINYLLIAKDCESFAVREVWCDWQDKPVIQVDAALEQVLANALQQSKDDFIRQRLLFQLIRFYYFQEKAGGSQTATAKNSTTNSKLMNLYRQYEKSFPHNLIYYRTLGYVAGYYYAHGNYALSNYLYSLGYSYSTEMRIPSKWSFHPQEEADWKQTLQLATTPEEKITLWHMLGMENDPGRGILEIIALDPQSEKADLLLSRLINSREASSDTSVADLAIIDGVARAGKTAKPYFWNLGAGYLHFLHKDYAKARAFYAEANKQLPAGNKYIAAQYKLLTILLLIDQYPKLDANAETTLVEPLNWLADLRDQKDTVNKLRFANALTHVSEALSVKYTKQKDKVKAVCFSNNSGFYAAPVNVTALLQLLNKTDKSAFENAMLRYYPLKADDLYYHQATVATFREQLDQAIELMKKAGDKGGFTLPGNPFNGRINDCHDCDHEALQKTKYTSLSFLETMKKMKEDIAAGKDVYSNALLLGNAYYNITHYGNARAFSESPIISAGCCTEYIDSSYRFMLTSCASAEKYYQLASQNATNNEQRAKCAFLSAKCERNRFYNWMYTQPESAKGTYDHPTLPPAGKYFALLNSTYSNTAYYKEALKECGYFQDYVYSTK